MATEKIKMLVRAMQLVPERVGHYEVDLCSIERILPTPLEGVYRAVIRDFDGKI